MKGAPNAASITLSYAGRRAVVYSEALIVAAIDILRDCHESFLSCWAIYGGRLRKPYHAKLEQELNRLKAEFGNVLLWEAHSIASILPRLFEGKLPDLNVGTNSGTSCDASVLDAITASLDDQPFTWVENGRFKGGHITRAYGQPADGVHAVQLEICQSTYMNETAPFDYRPDLAARVVPVVERIVSAALRAVRLLAR